MSASGPDPVDQLRELQRLVRQGDPPEQPALWILRNADDEDGGSLGLSEPVVEAMLQAESALIEDLRFERMQRTVRDDVRQLVRDALNDREADVVASFVERHANAVEERICFIPIEHLRVSTEREVFGIRVLPIDHAEVPDAHHFFSLDPPVGAVGAVPVIGTHLTRMAERAQAAVEQALKVLRVALRAHRMLPSPQLRFRIGENFTFGPGLAGFQTRAYVEWEVELDDELTRVAEGEPLAALSAEPSNDLERRAQIALTWLAEGAFEGDDVKRMLYLTFALEALLGDRSERLKAHGLAYRRAVLGKLASEGGAFRHANRIVEIYSQARSAAVHGEKVPGLATRFVDGFAWDVRRALNEVLVLAAEEGITRRRNLRRFLNRSEAAEELAEWIRAHALDNAWGDFLAERSRS